MSKIVYLFGAGASFGTLPMVAEMEEWIAELVVLLSRSEYSLSDESYFNDPISRNQSKRMYQLEMIKGLEELQEACENHYSIDTYAKKLFIKQDIKGLKKLKVLLSVYFTIEQINRRPNKRYDFFLASIMDRVYSLPKHIRILNWNYDSQFEIAFSEFLNELDLYENKRHLNIYCRNGENEVNNEGKFSIFKLNGSTEFREDADSSFYLYPKAKAKFDNKFIEFIVGRYAIATYKRGIIPIFTFAWEKYLFKDFFDRVTKEIYDAEILVVIGYSFPYFNREIDREIISNMKILSKVYFQSPEASELIERFKTMKTDVPNDKLIPITDLKYFYLPSELS